MIVNFKKEKRKKEKIHKPIVNIAIGNNIKKLEPKDPKKKKQFYQKYYNIKKKRVISFKKYLEPKTEKKIELLSIYDLSYNKYNPKYDLLNPLANKNFLIVPEINIEQKIKKENKMNYKISRKEIQNLAIDIGEEINKKIEEYVMDNFNGYQEDNPELNWAIVIEHLIIKYKKEK